MATDKHLDASISQWLEQTAPARLPERVLHTTFERTRRSRQQAGWRTLLARLSMPRFVPALGGVVVVVVAAALALNYFVNQQGLGGPDLDSRTPFLGVWISTSDSDGGTQTMTVERADNNTVDIVVTDTIATVCSLTPSTMTGAGTIDGKVLVIPTPDYRCDDGSEPQAISGPPLDEQLRNLTYVRDPERDVLTVGEGVWLREGAEAPSPSPQPSGPLQTSDSMWPQSTLEEVRQAQELADAGDPDFTWQVGARLVEDSPDNEVESEIIDRFLREGLGWEKYLFMDAGTFSDWEGAGMDGWVEGSVIGQRYVRCGPGRTNSLYPPQPDSEDPGESCAPTIDNLHYETVSFDLAQLDRQGRDGIWVVSRWGSAAPFAQVDPAVAEAQATERLEEFLAARVAGNGAEAYLVDFQEDVPLLYATTSGAAYERYEFVRMAAPQWPDGRMTFSARLFADGDATVVEQEINTNDGGVLWLDAHTTTENGEPLPTAYEFFDGQVSVTAAPPWGADDLEHWSALKHYDHGEQIYLIDDPRPVAGGCFAGARAAMPKPLPRRSRPTPSSWLPIRWRRLSRVALL